LIGQMIYTLPINVLVDGAFPFPCTAGTLGSDNPAHQISAFCAGACPAEYYCPNEATITPTPCPAGSFCPEGVSMPLPCPAGTYSNATRLHSEAQCQHSAPGFFSSTNATTPTACAPGAYSDTARATECVMCADGEYQRLEGRTACDVCIAGTYCPAGSSSQRLCPGVRRTKQRCKRPFRALLLFSSNLHPARSVLTMCCADRVPCTRRHIQLPPRSLQRGPV
jgi:hypothetical protein